MGEKSRIDIKRRNVFISWTGVDVELKDKIVERLEAGKLACTVSDGKSTSEAGCSGNFEEWSINAAKSANIFLLILTENTLQSKYVPVEIKEALTLDGAESRFIVVCKSVEFWQNATFVYGNEWTKELSQRKISVIEMPDDTLTADKLDEIYLKTMDLVNNRADYVYRAQTRQASINLLSLYNQDIADRKFGYDKLYIERQVTEKDEDGVVVATHFTPADLVQSGDVFYIYGPAGCGKTQYIHQLHQSADDNSVVISLSCSAVASSTLTLYEQMYDEFCRVIGQENYYSKDNFNTLISLRHVVLVLDGLDEIATQVGVTRFMDKVEQYYQPNRAHVTLFFTGRDEKSANRIAFSNKSVRRLQLDKLTEEEIERLGNNLFLAFDASEQSKAFYVSVKDLSDEIRTNPLLLSQLAIIYKSEGKVPDSVVGIFDAISEITLRIDDNKRYVDFPEAYMDMLVNVGELLKHFAHKRYLYQSQGKLRSPLEIFMEILRAQYPLDFKKRAEYLMEYLLKRAILVKKGEEFYHKMFMEYFTAVYYFENSCMSDCIFDYDTFGELFSHYNDPYWTQVIQLFLVKADSKLDGETVLALYGEIIKAGEVLDYTLLLDTCRDLVVHKDEAQVAIVQDILYKSATKVYPPYGPLFWYVPTYELYEQLLLATDKLATRGEIFAKAVALARDVCYIYGQKHIVSDFTDRVDGKAIFNEAVPHLSGVRKALCVIFYLGDTDANCGADIYPRCFNVAETLSMRDNNCGVGGRMFTPFKDELDLYCHESYNELNGEYIGFISCPYNKEEVERTLRAKSTYKVTGMAFSPTDDIGFLSWQKYDRIIRNSLYEQYEAIGINISYDNVLDPTGLLEGVNPTNIPQFYKKSLCITYYPENFIENWNSEYDDFNYAQQLICDCVIGVRDILYLYGDVTGLNLSGSAIEEGMFYRCSHIRKLSVPQGITEIGDEAFRRCEGLQEIQLPDGLKTIGSKAFQECKSLQKVVVPDSVETMGYSVFESCENLMSVYIPDTVTEIGSRIFTDCPNLAEIRISVDSIASGACGYCVALKEIHIQHGVTVIEDYAFSGCANLTTVTIPDSVTQIGKSAFSECVSLKEIVIPDSVTQIDEHAFKGCAALSKVTLPKGLTKIADHMFDGCACLKEIELPNGIVEIGAGAFSGSGLAAVCLPDSVVSVSYQAFNGCVDLCSIRIPDSVTSFGQYALARCPKLTEVTLPLALTSLPNALLASCSGLKQVTVPNAVTTIGNYAFYNCKNLERVELNDGLTKICGNVFEGCDKLTELAIPSSVKEISPWAFDKCLNLATVSMSDIFKQTGSSFGLPNSCQINWIESQLLTVYVPEGTQALTKDLQLDEKATKIVVPNGVTSFGDEVFKNFRNLREINVPDSVTQIGKHAFYNCSQLQQIKLPSSVTQIGIGAFEKCTSLSQIDIPDTVLSIGANAFHGCNNLASVRLPSALTRLEMGVFGSCYALTEIDLPKSLTHIGDQAFSYSHLKQVTIPESIEQIGAGAFGSCWELTAIVIPSSITALADNLFAGSRNLKEVTLPDGLTKLGDSVFAGCSSLTNIVLPATLTEIGSEAFSSCEALTEITVPQQVAKIDRSTFSGCKQLVTVYLPDGLTEIGRNAFCACSSLTSIILPQSLKIIDEDAFSRCTNLKEIAIPYGVTQIGPDVNDERGISALSILCEGVFGDCTSLANVVIPDSVLSIGDRTFANCAALTQITIPDSVKAMGAGVFFGCSSLQQIVIPDSVTILSNDDDFAYDDGVFCGCKSLKQVYLSRNLTGFAINMFHDCASLEEITLPHGIEKIRKGAFYGCSSLKSVTIPSSVYEIEDSAFNGCVALENVTIGRNFTNDIERIFGYKPKKINFI